MRRFHNWLTTCITIGLLMILTSTVVGTDELKEEKVPLDKVPKAVLKAVKAKFKGAELVRAQTEKDNGKLVYEIVIKDKGQSVEVSVTPDGKIVSFERTIAAKDLPRPVKDTLDRKYPKAKLRRAEELHENDKTTYEVLLGTANKKQIEIVLGRDGKIIKEEKAESDEKEKKDK